MMTECQSVRLDGLTQASRVIPMVRSSTAASATVTRLDVPLNEIAFPNLPAAANDAFESVPVLLLPVESRVEVPVPSSKPYAASTPGCPTTAACAPTRVRPACQAITAATPNAARRSGVELTFLSIFRMRNSSFAEAPFGGAPTSIRRTRPARATRPRLATPLIAVVLRVVSARSKGRATQPIAGITPGLRSSDVMTTGQNQSDG